MVKKPSLCTYLSVSRTRQFDLELGHFFPGLFLVLLVDALELYRISAKSKRVLSSMCVSVCDGVLVWELEIVG